VISLVKTINLPDDVYEDLENIAKELSRVANKQISTSMAVYLVTAVYKAYLSEPCARDAFMQKIANSQIMTPEEFENFSLEK
jgi:hypothetical protein